LTESEWLGAYEPTSMLVFLRNSGKASGRKLRLFGCAAARRIWDMLADDRLLMTVELAETFADGQAGREQLAEAWARARGMAVIRLRDVTARPLATSCFSKWMAAVAAAATASVSAMVAASGASTDVVDALAPESEPGWRETWATARSAHAALVRDIFGNPFAVPPRLAPSLLNGEVLQLAEAAYEHRSLPSGHLDAARLAVLADALESAGCTAAELLGHLRGAGPHVRACFAVDAVLGRC
jgi:hypothetical protein